MSLPPSVPLPVKDRRALPSIRPAEISTFAVAGWKLATSNRLSASSDCSIPRSCSNGVMAASSVAEISTESRPSGASGQPNTEPDAVSEEPSSSAIARSLISTAPSATDRFATTPLAPPSPTNSLSTSRARSTVKRSSQYQPDGATVSPRGKPPTIRAKSTSGRSRTSASTSKRIAPSPSPSGWRIDREPVRGASRSLPENRGISTLSGLTFRSASSDSPAIARSASRNMASSPPVSQRSAGTTLSASTDALPSNRGASAVPVSAPETSTEALPGRTACRRSIATEPVPIRAATATS